MLTTEGINKKNSRRGEESRGEQSGAEQISPAWEDEGLLTSRLLIMSYPSLFCSTANSSSSRWMGRPSGYRDDSAIYIYTSRVELYNMHWHGDVESNYTRAIHLTLKDKIIRLLELSQKEKSKID